MQQKEEKEAEEEAVRMAAVGVALGALTGRWQGVDRALTGCNFIYTLVAK